MARTANTEPIVAALLRREEEQRHRLAVVKDKLKTLAQKQEQGPQTLEELVQAARAEGFSDVPEAILCSLIFDLVDEHVLGEDDLGRIHPIAAESAQ